MLEILSEWCADIFGLTMRSRSVHLVLGSGALVAVSILMLERWGPVGLLLPAALLGLAALSARAVKSARNAAWRAACLPLEDARQWPDPFADEGLIPPTGRSLHHLSLAVDEVRRGLYAAANDELPRIDRDLLRPEETQLLDAVRAMISLGLGDGKRAAQQAVAALPTGSHELDACLGRTVLAEAWNMPERLRAIERAWDRAGLAHDRDGTFHRLHELARLRIDDRLLDGLDPPAARALADEARAVGDDLLAAELDARSRESAYR